MFNSVLHGSTGEDMADPTDLIVQATFMGEDDKRFAKEKTRRAAPKVVEPLVPAGPCCLRCANWKPPAKHDDFGVCLVLAAVQERSTFGPERGTIVAVEHALTQVDWSWNYLPTKPYLVGCSRYHEAAEGKVA